MFKTDKDGRIIPISRVVIVPAKKRKKPIKKSSYKKKKNFIAPKVVAWETSGRYANHMGSKFSLSNKQVKNNHSKHYRQALKDKDFFSFLIREYL